MARPKLKPLSPLAQLIAFIVRHHGQKTVAELMLLVGVSRSPIMRAKREIATRNMKYFWSQYGVPQETPLGVPQETPLPSLPPLKKGFPYNPFQRNTPPPSQPSQHGVVDFAENSGGVLADSGVGVAAPPKGYEHLPADAQQLVGKMHRVMGGHVEVIWATVEDCWQTFGRSKVKTTYPVWAAYVRQRLTEDKPVNPVKLFSQMCGDERRIISNGDEPRISRFQ